MTNISKPILYLSGYMEANRDEYIQALHSVDETERVELWLKFFFKSVAQQLKETQHLVESIYDLHDSVKNKFQTSKSPYLTRFIDFIFKSPVFTILMAREETKILSNLTIKRLVKLFIKESLVEEVPHRFHRAKIYRFKPLLDILR